jgi:hypothetical protein
MNRKRIDRLTAGFVFLWALVLYVSTMAPTASFWDPGERIASAFKLQVMHPPGAPFYLLLGRIFSMLAPSKETVALAVNMISVLSSAGTVMLTHLIIVRLVRRWQEDWREVPTGPYVISLVRGVIGALTYAATDSFWFNAGIAEVYAFSTFFTALVTWLVLRWSEAARREEARLKGQSRHLFRLDANRYLVLIAALFGMAIGVHLLSLLVFFFVALIVFFVEFDKEEWTSKQRWGRLVLAGLISAALFLAIYPGLVKGMPKVFDAVGTPVAIVGIVGLVTYGIYASHRRRMPKTNLAFMCLAVLLIGYGSYTLVYVRSATEPSIDMNDPDNIERFIDYLEREQYGATPLLSGVSFDDESGRVNPREGKETSFPRRHSTTPQHWKVYERYNSDLGFFLHYQVGYMYMRYFFWNFVGRTSDVQGASWTTGIPGQDPGAESQASMQTPSQKKSHNVYFALPLLLGLFGAFYHFNRDWRRALSVFVLFFVTGIGIIIYLNQTPMQPRERDYSYVGSFLAFSLWVGIGAGGLLQMVYESIEDSVSSLSQALPLLGVGLLVFLAVPGWMTLENYGDHDRSGDYVPRDYAKNMLDSVEKNAILFTNGDNDTYPLWYMQEVEGYRTDVRVVNLSLLNTPWYIRQLKEHRTYESAPLPISMANDQIEDIRATPWKPKEVQLPVQTETLRPRIQPYLSEPDTSLVESPMTWTVEGRPMGENRKMLRVADMAVYNMIKTVAEDGWKRPVYFAVTVARSGQLDLQNYFQLEGQAYRVLPIKHNQPRGRVIPGLTDERMSQFEFTNLADSTTYFNQNARRMLDGYRFNISHAAEQLSNKGHAERGRKLLSNFMQKMPFSTIPGDVRTLMFTARAFRALGDTERHANILREAQPLVMDQVQTADSRRSLSRALAMAGRVRRGLQSAGRQEALDAFDRELETILAETSYKVPPRIRRAYGLSSDSAGGRQPSAPGGMGGGMGGGVSSPSGSPNQ